MDVNQKNHYGLTPMHFAAIGGHTNILKLLIENGACCDIRSVTGSTPLHAAAANGRHDICELLYRDVPDCSVDVEDEEGAVQPRCVKKYSPTLFAAASSNVICNFIIFSTHYKRHRLMRPFKVDTLNLLHASPYFHL